MIWQRLLARQSRRPSGLIGRLLMGSYLDRVNAEINTLVYDALAPEPQQRVLEVGFGGAELLFRIAAGLDRGRIEGLELSGEMLDNARRRAARLGLADKTGFHAGSIDALPFADASFDRACSVHTIYFWPDLESGLAELARVLKPGGRLVLGFSTATDLRRDGWMQQGFQAYSTEAIVESCRRLGFENERLDSIPRKPRGQVYAYRGIRA